jgi:hypothetical protein
MIYSVGTDQSRISISNVDRASLRVPDHSFSVPLWGRPAAKMVKMAKIMHPDALAILSCGVA